jgi:hypothetical protein
LKEPLRALNQSTVSFSFPFFYIIRRPNLEKPPIGGTTNPNTKPQKSTGFFHPEAMNQTNIFNHTMSLRRRNRIPPPKTATKPSVACSGMAPIETLSMS